MKKGSKKKRAQRRVSKKAKQKAAVKRTVRLAGGQVERACLGLLKAMALVATASRRG